MYGVTINCVQFHYHLHYHLNTIIGVSILWTYADAASLQTRGGKGIGRKKERWIRLNRRPRHS